MTPLQTQVFFEHLGQGLGTTVVRRRGLVLLTSLLVIVLCCLGLLRAHFSTDYRIFFSREDPGLQAFQRLERAFTKTDNVLLVVKVGSGTIFQPDALGALEELTAEAWRLPFASRVDSLTNFQLASAQGDDISVRPLLHQPPPSLSPADLATLRDLAVAEPLLHGSLLSKDLLTAAVNVTVRLPGQLPSEVTETAQAARALVRRIAVRHPALDIRASGMVFVNDAFMQTSVKDMALMIPLMCLVMLVVMALAVRSKLATLAVALIIWVSAALSMALAGWLGYPLTPTAVAAPIIVLTVAVADGVHIVLAMIEEMQHGRPKDQAIVTSLRTNFEAITYTWLTTIIGFVCLNYSESPPVGHLANMTAVGVTWAYLFSFTLLPALLSFLPITAPAARTAKGPARRPVIEWVADFVTQKRVAIVAWTAVLTVIGGIFTARLQTNDQFIQYFKPSLPFRVDADFTMRNLSGLYRVEFLVDSGVPSGITGPDYLRQLDAFTGWLRQQPEVDHVYSLTDLVKRVHQVITGGAAAAYRLPETKEQAAEALLAFEMNLPAGLDLTDRVNIDKSSSRVTVTVQDLSTRQLTVLSHRAEDWLRHHAPAPMWARATGPVVIFAQLSDRNARSMVWADFLSLGLISLCMLLLLRSVSLGLFSMVLNVVPIIVGYGLWWLFVGQMNIVATLAASISLGIIVDDTIHFLAKFQTLRQEKGVSADVAMHATLLHTGPAIIATGAILSLGFGVLTFSSFQMTSHLGWLSLLIVTIAPAADLLLAPALVVLWHQHLATRAETNDGPVGLPLAEKGSLS